MSDNPRHVITLDAGTGITMAFRKIPAGAFRMGSRGMGRLNSWFNNEEPVHTVEITRPFWMAETPVTQTQFAVWTEAEGIDHKNHFKGKLDHPAENLNWHEAGEFCAWLRKAAPDLPRDVAGCGLPSEAQWEYACRGPDVPDRGHFGRDCEYHTGDGEAALAEAGWFGEDFESGSTHPVAKLKPNGWGLYDTHGNVWEWCRDVWNPDAYRLCKDGVEDPETTKETPGSDAEDRVLRGGSWFHTAADCRSAIRNWYGAGLRDRDYGFRVCLFPGPVAAASQEKRPEAEAGGSGAGERSR